MVVHAFLVGWQPNARPFLIVLPTLFVQLAEENVSAIVCVRDYHASCLDEGVFDDVWPLLEDNVCGEQFKEDDSYEKLSLGISFKSPSGGVIFDDDGDDFLKVSIA